MGSQSKSKSGGAKVAKAIGQGVVTIVALPVIATAAALYGSGKLVEGIGKGLSVGPEALLKSYRKMNGKMDNSTNPYVNGQAGQSSSQEGRGSRRHKN